jgi:hypothetical protein
MSCLTLVKNGMFETPPVQELGQTRPAGKRGDGF